MEPSSHFNWSSVGVTDTGRVRCVNEDAVILRPEIGLWAVADGMGGHEAGDIASAAVVRALGNITFPPDLNRFIETVKVRLEDVNRELLTSRGAGRMGSTAVILLAHGTRCACLWVGDSRAYRLRNNVMHAMTRDHSYVQELVQRGQLAAEDAENHPKANVITRAIGAGEAVDVEVALYDLKDGDRYLLCSDGLYQEVSEQELFYHTREDSCDVVADTLLALALQRGARDNVSLILVDFVESR